MKLVAIGSKSKVRPTIETDEAVLLALVGEGGFATLKLKTDKQGMFLEVEPLNPQTMKPW